MEVLKYNGYEGTAEVDIVRGVCCGKVLFIKDVVTYVADSPKDIQKEFEAAVDDYLETCKELGREPQKPFNGVFQVRVPPDMHKAAAVRALSESIKLNELMVRALDRYLTQATDVHNNIHITLQADPETLRVVAARDDDQTWEVHRAH